MSNTATFRKNLMHEVLLKCSSLNIPAQAVLELTYRCNLHCLHCYVDIEEPDELTSEEWKGAIDQLKAAGTMYLLFTGGEVTLRPDLLEIAGYARSSGFFVGFLTNCTLLARELARDIAGLKPFSIATSLYGASAAVHEGITGVTGSFEKTLDGISLLVDYGIKPIVQTPVMKSNLTELTRLEELVESLGAKASIEFGIAPCKSGSQRPFRCEPSLDDLVNCSWLPESGQNDNTCQGTCKAGKALCSVSPEGNISPCLMFPLKLGNFRYSKFNEIWSLEPCAELRYLRSIKPEDLYACKECELAGYCQRCTGVSYIESGRLDGPSASACRQAEVRRRLIKATEVPLCKKNHISSLR